MSTINKKDYTYFYMEESARTLDIHIHPRFHEITPALEAELIFFFTTIYFAIESNITFHMGNISHLSQKCIIFLLNLGKELNYTQRQLVLKEAPESLKGFLFKHRLDTMIGVEG
jgi:hypothetical protein